MSDLFSKLQPNNGYVIAEIACGHEGDPKKLKKLIDCVVESKCQIIKFQIFKTFERAIKGHKEWDIFSKLELSDNVWKKYITYAIEGILDFDNQINECYKKQKKIVSEI